MTSRVFVEYLREISRTFSAKFSRRKKKWSARTYAKSRGKFAFENFFRGVNAEKELFSWADLYVLLINSLIATLAEVCVNACANIVVVVVQNPVA